MQQNQRDLDLKKNCANYVQKSWRNEGLRKSVYVSLIITIILIKTNFYNVLLFKQTENEQN